MKTTKGDKVLIVFLILASILFSVFLWMKGLNISDKYISVQVDGKEIQTIEFTKENIGKTFEIETKFGRNVIEVGDGEVWITEASCPDKLDIKQGKIDSNGQMLVCLPNRLIVEIKENKLVKENQDKIDSYNY